MGVWQKALMGQQCPQESQQGMEVQGMELQELMGVVSDKLLCSVSGLRPRAGGKGGPGGAAPPALPWLLLPSPCLSPASGRTPSARRAALPSPVPCGATAPSGSWSKSHGPQEGTQTTLWCPWSCPQLLMCDLSPLSLQLGSQPAAR